MINTTVINTTVIRNPGARITTRRRQEFLTGPARAKQVRDG